MTVFILLCIIVLFSVLYLKFFKRIRCGNMVCITGGIKTGKSTLAIRQATQIVFWRRFFCYLHNYFFRFLFYPFYCWFKRFRVLPKKPLPELYSNIPLKCRYIPITEDFLKREVRPVYGSVAYICEASLVADSMTFKDSELNERLLLFNKLWGHASKGGYLIYDTQSISDNHYAVKRCLSSYIYIHHMIKGLFFLYFWVREERYSEDNSTINNYGEDVEVQLKLHIVPKSVWKLFDCYCYSCLTDDKPVSDFIVKKNQVKDLKARKIVSFKKFKTINKESDENEKN